jgi:hypothetical protein
MSTELSDLEIMQSYDNTDLVDEIGKWKRVEEMDDQSRKKMYAIVTHAIIDYAISHDYRPSSERDAYIYFNKVSKKDRVDLMFKCLRELFKDSPSQATAPAAAAAAPAAAAPAAAAPAAAEPPVEQYDESYDDPYLDSSYDSCDEPVDELPDEWYIEPTCEEQETR